MSVSLDWKDAGVSKVALGRYKAKLALERGKMLWAAKQGYKDERASINLCLDQDHLKKATQLARKHKNAALLLVVGIGGSNLGTIAVQEAVLGKLYGLHPGKRPRVLYVGDTVDPEVLATINAELERTLKARKKVVLNLISKSGGTTEPIANFQVLLKTLQKHRKDYAKHVVVTTDHGSNLWDHAKTEGFGSLPIPKMVGGRYSVFSHVGLFPLAVLGMNIKKLLAGATAMRTRCLKSAGNPAMIRAALLADARKRGKTIADNFYFKSDLESVGKWYRQLMGESIGKEWDRSQKKRVWMGITPTVSIGTTDLHSMAQLYFGGPKDKFHTIIETSRWRQDPTIPHLRGYEKLVPKIQGKKLSAIMAAVVQGVVAVLRKQKRPFCKITLEDCDEQSIGALLQLHMMEMMYLAALLDVNPFDQPNVEAYKVETKKVLG